MRYYSRYTPEELIDKFLANELLQVNAATGKELHH